MGSLIINPDCRDGKHDACNGDAYDLTLDNFAACECECHGDPNRPGFIIDADGNII